jgi:hypothetical protein
LKQGLHVGQAGLKLLGSRAHLSVALTIDTPPLMAALEVILKSSSQRLFCHCVIISEFCSFSSQTIKLPGHGKSLYFFIPQLQLIKKLSDNNYFMSWNP